MFGDSLDDWNDANFCAADVESSGVKPEYALQPWRLQQGKAWLTSFAWVWREGGAWRYGGGTFPEPAMVKSFLEWAIREGRVVVGWNVTFDVMWFLAMGFKDLVNQIRWLDGMLVWRHLDVEPEYDMIRAKKKSFSLKTAVPEFLPKFAGYEAEIDYHSDDPAELDKLHDYNVKDNVFALDITRRLYKRLTRKQRNAMWCETRSIPMVAEANLRGLLVDQLASIELSHHLLQTQEQMLFELHAHGVTETVVRSPKKLADLMFNQWKLPVLKINYGKKGDDEDEPVSENPSTDKEVLFELALIDRRAKLLRTYRESLNNRTKFTDRLRQSVEYNEDGCTHPQAGIFRTYTGRITVSSKQDAVHTFQVNTKKGVVERSKKVQLPIGWAQHQMKRDKAFRRQIIAPPGYDMIETDAAGQEFKWMACASGDPVMLKLCTPGEDPHSYMTAQIYHEDYIALKAMVAAEDKAATNRRKMGKIGNLCIAKGETVLTDRGPCSIEHVRRDDLVWDGEDFVAHDGVRSSGARWVIDHDGVLATPSHQVMVRGAWVEHDEVQRMGWTIDRACASRHAVRIVGGIARRAVREAWRDLRASALRLWDRARGQPANDGSGAIFTVQGLRCAPAASSGRRTDCDRRRDEAIAEARQRMVSALRKSEGSLVAQLRRAWDRVSVRINDGGSDIHQTNATTSNVSETRYRPSRQRWSLRAWKFALGHAQSEPRQSKIVETFDIVNCGPRRRFAVNGRIVHNSLQYRTKPPRLRVTARVDYDVMMTEDEAKLIWITYQRTYTHMPQYWVKAIMLCRQLGYAETFGGRRVKLIGDWDGKYGWNMGSTAINFKIQGTGADQKYLAMSLLRDKLIEYDGYFAFDLHDGIYMFLPEGKSHAFKRDVQPLLDDLPYGPMWGYIPPIPMTFDWKIGKSWGDLKGFSK